jgi:DNA end-binding protein Ku
MSTLLRYPYEVRDQSEYFDDIQDVTVTKDMLDLAKHIVNQKAGDFEPKKFEDHFETALIELINQKRAGKTIAHKPRLRGENVVDLMDALKRSISVESAPKEKKGSQGVERTERNAYVGQPDQETDEASCEKEGGSAFRMMSDRV